MFWKKPIFSDGNFWEISVIGGNNEAMQVKRKFLEFLEIMGTFIIASKHQIVAKINILFAKLLIILYFQDTGRSLILLKDKMEKKIPVMGILH